MHREWFNCWECGRTKANEYGECAYCGGDVVVMIAEAQMKERSIILSGDEMRGVFDGIITQIRRAVKLDEFGPSDTPGYDFTFRKHGLLHDVRMADMLNPPRRNYPGACPYGTIGDRLWLKETWRVGAWLIEDGMIAVDYRADGFSRREWLSVPDEDQFDRLVEQSCADAKAAGIMLGCDDNYTWSPGSSPCRWRPSIYMPRWASRITLEITDIRVERVQDISEEDARAEGVGAHGGWNADETEYGVNARGPFSHLWDSTNAKRHPWASNPWVWVIEFRRAK